MNGLKTRDEGIKLQFSGHPYLSPNLSENRDYGWRNSVPNSCELQGFFYEDEEDAGQGEEQYEGYGDYNEDEEND
jgi:hypothetical protein